MSTSRPNTPPPQDSANNVTSQPLVDLSDVQDTSSSTTVDTKKQPPTLPPRSTAFGANAKPNKFDARHQLSTSGAVQAPTDSKRIEAEKLAAEATAIEAIADQAAVEAQQASEEAQAAVIAAYEAKAEQEAKVKAKAEQEDKVRADKEVRAEKGVQAILDSARESATIKQRWIDENAKQAATASESTQVALSPVSDQEEIAEESAAPQDTESSAADLDEPVMLRPIKSKPARKIRTSTILLGVAAFLVGATIVAAVFFTAGAAMPAVAALAGAAMVGSAAAQAACAGFIALGGAILSIVSMLTKYGITRAFERKQKGYEMLATHDRLAEVDANMEAQADVKAATHTSSQQNILDGLSQAVADRTDVKPAKVEISAPTNFAKVTGKNNRVKSSPYGQIPGQTAMLAAKSAADTVEVNVENTKAKKPSIAAVKVNKAKAWFAGFGKSGKSSVSKTEAQAELQSSPRIGSAL